MSEAAVEAAAHGLVGGIKAARDLIRGNLPGWNAGASPREPS